MVIVGELSQDAGPLDEAVDLAEPQFLERSVGGDPSVEVVGWQRPPRSKSLLQAGAPRDAGGVLDLASVRSTREQVIEVGDGRLYLTVEGFAAEGLDPGVAIGGDTRDPLCEQAAQTGEGKELGEVAASLVDPIAVAVGSNVAGAR